MTDDQIKTISKALGDFFLAYMREDQRRRAEWLQRRIQLIADRRKFNWLRRTWLNLVKPIPAVFEYRLGGKLPNR